MTTTTPAAARFRPHLPANALIALVAVFIVLFCNHRLWGLVFAYSSGPVFTVVIGAVVFAIAVLLALPFSFKGAIKPWLAFLLISAAAASVLTSDFGAVADRHAVASVFETDRREAGEMMSLWVLARIGLLGVLPAALVFWTRIRWKPFLREAGSRLLLLLAAAGLLAIAIFGFGQSVSSFARNHMEIRHLVMPLAPINASINYYRHSVQDNRPYVKIGMDAHARHPGRAGDKPRALVVVVGESARSASFSLAGYGRDTNPELSRLPIAFFPKVQSCGTNTATSVPCMFSDLGRKNYDAKVAVKRDNALDLLARAGWKVTWIDNNAGSKKVAARLEEIGVMESRDPRWCGKEGCQDGMMVELLRERLSKVDADTVIVLHMLGSHGPAYYARYPKEFARFQPDCRGTDLQACTRAAIINTYDNTILYTDHVLAQMIGLLRDDARIDGALFYVSDHGESTGERGLYLHGAPWAIAPSEQTTVPMLAWASPGYAQRVSLDMACLRRDAGQAYSHDNFFDTLLGFGGVTSNAQRPALDITAACRRPSASPH